MAVATLVKPDNKATPEGGLWHEAEAILTAAAQAQSNPPTTTDPNDELRAQLLADGATTILGIVPAELFDRLCTEHGLYRFDHLTWTSSTRLTANASASRALATLPLPQGTPRLIREFARWLKLADGPTPSLLDYLWPDRHDSRPDYTKTQPVRLFLKVPLGEAFDVQRKALGRHGRPVGLAAVAAALTVSQEDAHLVMERRVDPIGYVRCERDDGTEMVAVIAQVGSFAPERAVLDWVRRHLAMAA